MTLLRVFSVFIGVAIFFSIGIQPASAVTTAIWEQQSQADFESGTPKHVSITSKGEVMLSPKLEPFFTDTQEVYIWCLAEDSKGNIYAGTGNEGKIYRMTPDGESSLFYDSPEVSIISLTVDANDNIYAGTAPSGLIYKIIGENAPPTTILRAEDKYVWAMTFDEAGNLYAATGTSGKIYKITPDGQQSVFFDSEERNILCLLYHEKGFYAGGDGKGTIYRITADGDAFVIYQTGQKEVRTLVMNAQGTIFAGTVTTAPPQPGSPPPANTSPPPGGGPPEEKKSKIYSIRPDGVVSTIWTAPEPLILAIVVLSDNQLLVGTGDSGKIYRVNVDGDSVALGKCDANQILAMRRIANADKILMATGNAGKIFELKSDYMDFGTLESDVNDTTVISRWGRLSWETVAPEGTKVSFATRSGNTENPDDTWSEWSEDLTDAEGAQTTSPPARFIQWRAKLTRGEASATPVLKRVRLASVQANIEPRVVEIQLQKGGDESQGGNAPRGGNPRESAPTSGGAGQGRTRYTITWKAQDANNDTLQYALYYKGVDETNWKLLKDELTQNSYTLDTTALPDGRYTVKVEATDKLSNPPNMVMSTEKVSDPFDIDNTQPTVREVMAVANGDDTYRISCVVEDQSSYIEKAVYKIDSDEKWQVMFPEDGIFDSRRENLLLHTQKLPPSAHTITIRVTDAAGNEAVGRGTF
jgi:sugar lactone lactonase YvrE